MMFKDKKFLIIAVPAVIVLLLFIALEIAGHLVARKNRSLWQSYLEKQPLDAAALMKLNRDNQRLKKKIERFLPPGVYLVIDSAQNTLYVKKGSEILQKVVVSCGSGNILEDPQGNRRWVFDTPRGDFQIQAKLRNPVWVKPDWAFIEEGKEIPKKQDDRIEEGVLGDYALGFGDGYFIHGTLYTRMLGRNVTHGCIRVGDDDLKALFKNVPVGARLFIF